MEDDKKMTDGTEETTEATPAVEGDVVEEGGEHTDGDMAEKPADSMGGDMPVEETPAA